MLRGSLLKRLLSLLLSVMLVVESGISSGLTGYAAETGTESQNSKYLVMAVAALSKNVLYQTVPVGTKVSELNLPKTIYALGIKESLMNKDEDSETSKDTDATKSELTATKSEASDLNATGSDISEDFSSGEGSGKGSENTEEQTLSTRSQLNKDADFMTDEQKKIIEKLLNSTTKPDISKLEKKSGLDLSDYEILKLDLNWENNTTLGGEFDSDVPGVYTFESSIKKEDKYKPYSVVLPTVTVEITDDLKATDSVIYPVYVETKNIYNKETLDFEISDLNEDKDARVYLFNSAQDHTEREAIAVKDGRFSIPLKDSDSDYFFNILASDSEISLQILTDNTDYQNNAGTNAITLSQEGEDFDLDKNSFMVVGKSPSITMSARFEDGGKDEASQKNLVGQDIKELLYIEYFIEDESSQWERLDSEAMKKLGDSEGTDILLSSPSELVRENIQPSYYSYDFIHTLYDTYIERDRATGKLSAHNISYRIAAENELSKYYFLSYEDKNGNEDPNGTVLRSIEIKNFTAAVKWNDFAGQKKDGSNPERPSKDEWLEHISLHKIVNDDKANPETVAISSDPSAGEGAISIDDKNPNEWTIKIRGYGYDKDDNIVHYYISESPIALNDATGKEGNAIINRHYEPKYSNVNNAANITDSLHDGGTLTNTLTGDTSFQIYSKWYDEADEETLKGRPETSIKLYRYPDNGQITDSNRWSNLSPIQDSKDVKITENIGTGDDLNRVYKLTLPQNDQKAAEELNYLDAYNQDGAELIYVGKVKKKGGTSTYLTSLITRIEEKNQELYKKNFILNGETLQNLITGKISVNATKTWNAAARQDVDAEVTLSLYKTTQDPEKNPETYRNDATRLQNSITLSGFTSERQSKSTVSVLDKYDEKGNKLYYFPKEESVRTKNKNTGEMENAILFKEDGIEYFLTGDNYRYKQSYKYGTEITDADSVSSVEAATSGSGDQSVTITNTLVGDAEIHIKKTFTNGLSEYDKERGYAEVTFVIYRNSRKIGTVTRTYKPGEYLQTIKSDGTVITKKIESLDELKDSFTDELLIDSYDDMEITGTSLSDTPTGKLPRYDENGIEYTYAVYEDGGIKRSGYFPTVHNSTREEKHNYTLADSRSVTEKYLYVDVSITNSIGESKHISVNKVWMDGGDSEGREPVSFVLEHKVNGSWEQVGTEHTIDPKEESFVYIDIPKEVEADYDAWKSGKNTGSFRIRETHVGENRTEENEVHYYDGQTNPIASNYPEAGRESLYLGHEWSRYEGGSKEDFLKPRQTADTYGFVKGSSYVYDALITDNHAHDTATAPEDNSSPEEDLNSNFDFTITNKRVGVVYLDIDAHNWIDGKLKDKARPDELKMLVRMGNIDCPVVLSEKNGWKKTFGPFKKYNEDGSLIDYSPILISDDKGKTINYIYDKKRAADEESFTGAYVMEMTENYHLGNYHTGDVYSFTLKHELKQSITPKVNKYWEDNAEGGNKRPDIVVNLYRSYTDETGTTYVSQIDKNTYINYEWNTDDNNWWYVTYDPQPRFSPNDYYEYSYYIKESMPSRETNEYVEIGAFPGSPKKEGKVTLYSYDAANPGLLNLTDGTFNTDSTKIPAGTSISAAKVTLSPDDAWTIVNRKRNKRTISGVKIYENLPIGFRAADLPKIKLELWRKVKASDEGEAVYEYMDGKDPLGQDTLILKKGGSKLTTVLGEANQSKETTFTFYDSKGNKAEVPKYDDKGRLYSYFIKEVGNKDTTEESEESKLLHHLFDLKTTDSLTNGIKAINGYKTDEGYEITFYKKWTVDASADKEEALQVFTDSTNPPSINVRLYRYLQDDSGKIINGTEELIKTTDTSNSENASSNKEVSEITLSYDSSHPEYSSYTWTKLSYYAPNLRPYVYVVSENMGSDGELFRKVYIASMTNTGDNVTLKGSEINLYELKAGDYTALLPSGAGKITHKSDWTGFDTVVTESEKYVIDPQDNYKGHGKGTAGLVNVYTGEPEIIDNPGRLPFGSNEGTKENSETLPNRGGSKEPVNEKEGSSGVPQIETPENTTDPHKTPEPQEPINGTEIKVPDKSPEEAPSGGSNGAGSGGAGGAGGAGSGTPVINHEEKTPSSHKDVYEDYDSSDSSDEPDMSITVPKEQQEITFLEFLTPEKYSENDPYDNLKAILNAQRPIEREDKTTLSAGRPSSPQTGDDSKLPLYGLGVLISFVIFGGWMIVFKRKKENNL